MTGLYRLGVMQGDGIGPEIVPAAVRVIDAAITSMRVPPVEWVELPIGQAAISSHGDPLPKSTIDGLESLDGWLLGPHDSVSYPEEHSSRLNPSGTLRKHFDLYANIRPAKSFGGINAVVEDTDLVIVRENTEGFYADRNTFMGTGEMMPTSDVAIVHGIITRERTLRIAHKAFRLARTRRRHVTIVHKANVLRMSSGLFVSVCTEVAAEYPDVEVSSFHIDALAARLVRRADEFDVILGENMFGDILSDLTGEIAGSLGIAPSINCSDTRAMAQATHGSAPDIAGLDRANPTGMILSVALLLRWLAEQQNDRGLESVAQRVEEGIQATIHDGMRTPDLGGKATTSEFTDAIVHRVVEKGRIEERSDD